VSAFTIRQASAADADAIADVIAAIEPADLVSEIPRDVRRDRFAHYLSTGQNVSFVAEADGRVVGELSVALRRPEPSELGFGVHPAWRRRGIASALVAHAVAWADTNDVHKLVAQVLAHNVAALALLRRQGFAEEGYLVNQFRREAGGASDAVLLARTKP
jgi:putative acetyltransferase